MALWTTGHFVGEAMAFDWAVLVVTIGIFAICHAVCRQVAKMARILQRELLKTPIQHFSLVS